MRAWNPDLFSDSERRERPVLARPVFEYQLDTLTSRNEEAAFEYFCRALAEKTICPNLRAQAGPMGGGDGKVDTETYPVADAVSDSWWIGAPRGDERWAFAFSAMKDWKKKVRSDVAKIAGTDRGYGRIYFITNQFAKASTRASLEVSLAAEFAIPLTILDRAWIVQKVYDDGFLDLAIETLNIPGVQIEARSVTGAHDARRLAELQALDAQIADPGRYSAARYQLVEDVLKAALLARGLERPRFEIEGRFAHARRLADEGANAFQLQRIAYDRAWTAYWWFEDREGFNRLYGEVEQHARGTDEARRLEMLSTLWQVLHTAVVQGHIPGDGLAARTAHLEAELNRLIADEARPNNALYAETLMATVRLNKAWASKDRAAEDAVWRSLTDIIKRSGPLGTYPIEMIAQLTERLGANFDGEAYDGFFETLTDVMRRRRSDGEAGGAYLARGWQKLGLDKAYDAIRMFGRAEALLIKEEYRDELISALAGASAAYQKVGLEWAARNKLLAAAERALSVLKTEGSLTRASLDILQRLVWAELGLGRVPQILVAMRLMDMVRAALDLEDDEGADFLEQRAHQDAVLAIHLMRTPVAELPSLEKLPNMLNGLGLGCADAALIHALGHGKELLAEGCFSAGFTEVEMDRFFAGLRAQPAADEIARRPTLFAPGTSTLTSVILGCEIRIDLLDDPVAIAIAESLLGGLEAVLATSNEDDVLPYRETLKVKMTRGADDLVVPAVTFPDSDAEPIDLSYPVDLPFRDPAQTLAYADWLQETIVGILVRMVRIRDIGSWMDRIAGEEHAFGRAVTLGNVLSLTRNIFGDDGRLTLAPWIVEDAVTYPSLRTIDWDDAPTSKTRGPTDDVMTARQDRPDYASLKHTDRKVLSAIDMPLWDKAGWGGVGFAAFVDHSGPPMVMLLFRDEDAGRAIFKGWRARFGTADQAEVLRVAIVTGLRKSEPTTYAMIIGLNPDTATVDAEPRMLLSVTRMQRMETPAPENLARFLEGYEATGAYFLVGAVMRPGTAEPVMFEDLAILKRSIELKPAWTIGENDMDMSVLDNADDPLAPADVEAPPVTAALARIRDLRAERRPT